ncbi:nitroreductase [Maricaulis sp. W15]|uniref:nitroreductase family protein n=1 Tax=Maricaulis sp. W15 TaxID=1772333 RepID=UPI0009FA1862|nr:nitroreductase [Maricaulis sp. W15]
MNDRDFTQFPAPGDRLAPCHPSPDTLALLTRRRSATAITMADPGPSQDQLDHLLGIAARVPDHGKLAPWRFIVFQGDARDSFGRTLGEVFAAATPDATEAQIAFETGRFTRAPLVIAVISTVLERHKVPEWEQILSAGAVCQNLLIAASAMGYGAQWLTEWYAFDPQIKATLGLGSGERIAGFVYVGTVTEEPVERPRPQARVDHWTT